MWATTWVNHEADLERYAELLGLPAGLDRIRFNPADDRLSARESGKRTGVAGWLAEYSPAPEGRVAVWVDDDLGDGDRDFAAFEGIVVVRPSPASGLANSKLRASIGATLGRPTASP